MLKFYKLRIDFDSNKVAEFRELEKRYFDSYIRSLEGIDEHNVHYHYYVETIHPSVNIRRYIQTHIGKGNGIYSLRELDERYPLKYLSYIVKDDSNSVWYKMPPTLREEVIAFSAQVSLEVAEKKKKKKNNKVMDLMEYCEKCKTFKDVSKEIVYYYMNKDLVLNGTVIRNYIWTIALKKGIVSLREYLDKFSVC